MDVYVSKPQHIVAIQWTGDKESFERMLDATMPVKVEDELLLYAGKEGAQGWVPVPVGHWVVRSLHDTSDHWPVDPDYFANKYRPWKKPKGRGGIMETQLFLATIRFNREDDKKTTVGIILNIPADLPDPHRVIENNLEWLNLVLDPNVSYEIIASNPFYQEE